MGSFASRYLDVKKLLVEMRVIPGLNRPTPEASAQPARSAPAQGIGILILKYILAAKLLKASSISGRIFMAKTEPNINIDAVIIA